MLNPAPERLRGGQRRGGERRDAPESAADGVRPLQDTQGLQLPHVVSTNDCLVNDRFIA